MSPLDVSMSTSAASVGGTFSVMSPEPVSTFTFHTSPLRSALTEPLPVSSETWGEVSPVTSMLPEPVLMES
jgi:hypothetical protein